MDTDDIRRRLADINDPLVGAVARWEVSFGVDDAGEPVVDVVIVLRDAELKRVWKRRGQLRQLVRARLQEDLPRRWPYVSFSAESEALNPEEAAA